MGTMPDDPDWRSFGFAAKTFQVGFARPLTEANDL